MSHNIMEWDVQVGLEMAWHGLTKIVKKIAKATCGICDYEMITVPNFYEIDGEKFPSGDKKIVSLDNKRPIGLSVGNDYSLISNSQVFDMTTEALAGTKHQIVSAGSVENRAICFLSVEIDKGFKAAGRMTEAALNILWGHGGKMPLIAKTGFTVVVCKNTFNAAMKEKGDFKFSIKHTKNAELYIPNMSKAIDAHLGVRAEFKRAMDELADISCNETKARETFAGIITPDKSEEVESGEKLISTRTMGNIERLTELFQKGEGNNGDDFADVLNAITDFYTHESSGGENRWKQNVSSEFGAGGRMKENAYKILTDKNQRIATAKRGAKLLASV